MAINPPQVGTAATIVQNVSDVKTGCVYFPPQQPLTVACPEHGEVMEVPAGDGMVSKNKAFIPGVLTFKCGWSGFLINGTWIKR